MKQYCVLTIHNEVLKVSMKEFVSPNEKVSEVIDRYSGDCVITNIEYGDYEFYLNQKLNFRVDEYNESYNHYRKTLESMLNAKCPMAVGIDTLNCIKTNIEVSEKQIVMLFNRMIQKDFNIENEEAHIIYDLIKRQGRSV